MKRVYLFILFIPSILFSQNQNWVDMMQDPNVNFYETQSAFNTFWDGKSIEKGKGWKQFKRWENFIQPRVYPDGRIQPQKLYEEYLNLERENNFFRMLPPNIWTQVGPDDVPLEGSGRKRGIGRLNAIVFHPTNPDILYVGAPAGGFWKSVDAGQNWTTSTDFLTNIGVSDIAIHPNNPDTLFIITGDRDGGDTYSYGVMKSYDGGNTWQTTGLSFDVNLFSMYRGNRILIDPVNPDIIITSTSNGVYRSTDGGDNFTHTFVGENLVSMEFHPTNSNIIYAGSKGSTTVYKSADNGITWLQSGTGLPLSSDVSRACIAVTNDNSNVVYALFGNNDNGFYALYKSSDEGNTWSQQSNSPNLLGWSTTGSDNGGQAWYDLALTVSPLDENIVFVGGVNCWKSDDSGVNWTLNTHWYGGGGANYMHADEHMLQYNTLDNKVYSANDGGLYVSDDHGNNWTDISDGLHITQFYRLGVSQTVQNLVIGGTQDNGTFLKNQNNWDAIIGGDGMECIIDYTDEDIMYGSVYYGDIRKSTNGGNSFSSIAPSNNGAWVTPYILDKTDPNTIYIGYDELYKSTDGGGSWNIITNGETNGGRIDRIDISKSNSDIIFFSDGTSIYKTDDGGLSWLDISSTLPNSLYVTGIAIHQINPNRVWLTFSGYFDNEKVYFSDDGGNTWTNISGTLPNVPANCIIINELDSLETIYLGTDLGVFTKDSTSSNWNNLNSGTLPNVIVNELEIQYSSNKLFAATYGRGLWSLDLQITTPPIADFSVDDSIFCSVPAQVNFTNNSFFSTSYFWDFGDGNTSTATNPSHNYLNYGNYTVSLIATGPLGVDTIVYPSLINISTSNTCIVTLPSSGQGNTQTACNGTLYDVGGPNGNYYDNCDSWITIEPTGANQVTLNFLDFDIEAPSSQTYCNWDYLEIFDGNSTSSPSLGQYCNTLTGSPGIITSTGGAITILLHADQAVNGRGFEIDWSCSYPINQKTYVPDDNFENYLEANGMGDGIPLNDSVLTSNIDSVNYLNVSGQSITDLTGIEDFNALKDLLCGGNQLTTIDLSSNTLLDWLDLNNNQLTTIDLSSNNVLRILNCFNNNITSLDLNSNILLETLSCSSNSLSNLDLSSNILLQSLTCEQNQIVNLDLSNNLNLQFFYCFNNQLTSLDLRNGNNTNMFTWGLDFTSNPSLTCINVDDSTYSANNWTNIDPQSYFSNNCAIYGCTDPTAFNYDSLATNDNCSCLPFIYGCTDPNAINYYPAANTDDGSCIYIGCTDNNACNYNPLATISDSSCFYGGCGGPISGCIDPLATNFNSWATIDDGSCVYCIYGCIDPLASNFNPLATCDDGSCSSPIWGCTYSLSSNYNPLATLDDGSCITSNHIISLDSAIILPSASPSNCFRDVEVFVSNNDTLGSQSNCDYHYTLKIFKYDNGQFYPYCSSTQTTGSIIPVPGINEGTYYIMLVDSFAFGTLWYPNFYISSFFGTSWSTLIYHPSVYDFDTIVINTNSGCTDSTALNYDSLATCNDLFACIYPVYGCTDSSAINYFAGANVDDGSCSYSCLNDTVTFNYSACDEYIFNGDTLIASGTYYDTLINIGGCDSLVTLILTIPDSIIINANVSNVSVYGASDGSIDVYNISGGNPPFSYSWIGPVFTSTSSIINNLSGGYYNLTITDSSGCMDSITYIVFEPPCNLLLTTSPYCYGDSTFSWGITNGVAPYTSLIEDSNGIVFGPSTNMFNNISFSPGGFYTLTVGDSAGCLYVKNIVIPTNSINISSSTIIHPSFSTSYDGSISVDSVLGGISPYTYLWTTGDTTLSIDSLSEGAYDITITDYNGCSFTSNYFLTSIMYGCTDSLALNYDSLATIDDSSCVYYNCQEPAPINIYSNNITDIKATINWDNMNSNDCKVLKYIIRYREVGNNNWITKSGGVGNGLCNFGVNTTSKLLQNLSPSTTYQYKIKAFYCYGHSSTWSLPKYFTTKDACPPMINLSTQTFNGNPNKVTFSWDTTGAYVFARIALRVNNPGSSWQTAGGFGVYYPTLFVNKFGLSPGTDYRGQGRTFCDSNITSYRSWWTSPIFWTQPNNRLIGGHSISNLDVYPNPSDNLFNISFNSDIIQDLNIRVLNSLGQVIFNDFKNQFVGEYTKQLNLENYRQGVYLLEIQTGEDIIYKKIILN